MRCATTWTFACLQAHPDITFPGGKQIHFWDKRYDPASDGEAGANTGVDWYQSIFDPDSPVAEGEITPAYAVLPDERVAAIARFAPDLRVFYVVRHPIDRAWSGARKKLQKALKEGDLDDRKLRKECFSTGNLLRTAYRDVLVRWSSMVPPEQLHS